MAKTLSIIKQIQEYKPITVDLAFQKTISFSQLSMYLSCPKKWSLQYRDGHKIPSFSINMTFGTSMHETLHLALALRRCFVFVLFVFVMINNHKLNLYFQ